MDLEIRPIFDDELLAFRQVDATAFGVDVKDEDEPYIRGFLELDRTQAAFTDGRLVGSSAALSWTLTVPGPRQVRSAAVTWVGVLPTHRRRGVLTSMMAALLDDAAERGEPLAMLLASESVIYGRFGYGLATSTATYEIEKAHTAFRSPVDAPGSLRIIQLDEARTVFPEVFARDQAGRVGEVSRSPGAWAEHLADLESYRDGASHLFTVVHETGGRPDGYAAWRIREDWSREVPNHVADVVELVAADPAVRLALGRFCFDLDLVGKIRLSHFPVDDPIRWALVDPRRLTVTRAGDLLWVRVLDVPVALSARTYAFDDRLVLDVHDAFRPDAGGRFLLEASSSSSSSSSGASCTPTDAEPDLALASADLGAVYLGGVSFGTLVRAGRIVEHTPGAADRATRLFAVDPLPYCDTDF